MSNLKEIKILNKNGLNNKKLNLTIEIECHKILKEEKAREVHKHETRKKEGQVIVDQIQKRPVQRMKDQENRDKKRFKLLSNIEKTRYAD